MRHDLPGIRVAGGDGLLAFVDLWLRNTSRIGWNPKWDAPCCGKIQEEPFW